MSTASRSPASRAASRREQLLDEPSVYTIINTNSPLKLDMPMMEGIIQMSGNGQVVIVTPFTLAGAMAPVTVAGALVQQNAEALAGIAFAQMVRKGAPVGYGGFTSNVDMKSGAPAFGTPEYMKAQIVGGQLARRYSIPYRTSNTCAANTVDAQAAYESVFSLWGAIQGGGNFMLHVRRLAGRRAALLLREDHPRHRPAADGGRVPDAARPFRGCARLSTPSASSARAAISSARQHTQDRYKTAFYSPIISDWRNFETWAEAGIADRAGARQPRVEGAAGDLRGAVHGPGDPRGAQRLRRKAQGRRRRADGFLRFSLISIDRLHDQTPTPSRFA